MQAYVLVSAAPGKLQDVVSRITALQGVKSVHACWGLPDVFVFLEVGGEDQLANLVIRGIQCIEGIERTETHIVIPEPWFQ